MKTKQIQVEGLENPVTIWKMNNGFSSDLKGQFMKISMNIEKQTGGRAPQQKVDIDMKAQRIYTLVYGILESKDLGISHPSSLGLGLNGLEEDQRMKAVRQMDSSQADTLYTAITELNSGMSEEELEEIQKK